MNSEELLKLVIANSLNNLLSGEYTSDRVKKAEANLIQWSEIGQFITSLKYPDAVEIKENGYWYVKQGDDWCLNESLYDCIWSVIKNKKKKEFDLQTIIVNDTAIFKKDIKEFSYKISYGLTYVNITLHTQKEPLEYYGYKAEQFITQWMRVK